MSRLSISTLAAVGCGLAVAACGSSASHSAQARNGQRLLAFSQCMRAHGVPKFPDPSARGGIQISPSTGVNPQSPAFQAAQNACGGLGKGGPGGGHPTEADKVAMLNVSKCMRAHGLTNFPDPTLHAPTPGNGVNAVIGRNGVFWRSAPGSIRSRRPLHTRRPRAVCWEGRARPREWRAPPRGPSLRGAAALDCPAAAGRCSATR